MRRTPLTQQDFSGAIISAKQRFRRICDKHPNLRAYLVISLPTGQIEVDSSVKEIAKSFPNLIFDELPKSQLLQAMKRMPRENISPQQKSDFETKKESLVSEIIRKIRVYGDAQFELRFFSLDYPLIWKLQTDELIDRKLTPQTKASIQIVIGTLVSFSTDF